MILTKEDISNRLNSLIDIDFIYKNIQGSICPFSFDNICVTYDNDYKGYTSIENAINDKDFLSGKSILEICHEFEPI